MSELTSPKMSYYTPPPCHHAAPSFPSLFLSLDCSALVKSLFSHVHLSLIPTVICSLQPSAQEPKGQYAKSQTKHRANFV